MKLFTYKSSKAVTKGYLLMRKYTDPNSCHKTPTTLVGNRNKQTIEQYNVMKQSCLVK
jgi:hypothetical protein